MSFALFSFGATSPAAAAARIVVINNDDPGEGFNDPTPAAPLGGNPGTTKGAQRLIAFNHAAKLWGLMLDSNVEILVLAQFSSLGANVLGSAGATAVFSDFGGAPGFPGAAFPGTWYQSALADKRAGVDLLALEGLPDYPDIVANFSSDFDFYLGLDNDHGARIDLVTVVLHEIGHGLGFANFVNEATGANFGGVTDVYSQFTLDTTTNTLWADLLSDAARAASARRADKISWNGANVTAAVPFVLKPGRPEIDIRLPPAIAQSARVGTAAFGPALNTGGVTNLVVLGIDPSVAGSPSPTDACSPLTNGAAVAGRIALVDRGTCAFTIKVKNAQDAGAAAVLVADNVADEPAAGLGGVDPTITIPSVRITRAVGDAIKAQLAASQMVKVRLALDRSQRAGADPAGLSQLYATAPVQPGSSISHFDSIAFRNQLMEPAINPDLTHELIPPFDMTLPQMRDIGWYVDGNLDGGEDPTLTIGQCTTDEPNVQLANGAMLVDQVRVWSRDCSSGAQSDGQFLSCMRQTLHDAGRAGLITKAQGDAVLQCAAQPKTP